ncbi:hypothetical protein KKA24_00700 [Patescibacteria group bacterium]|nr:hypothetical protein [Patescibacteria group bacterium]
MRTKTKTLNRLKFDTRCFCILGALAVLFLLAFYIYQVNAETSEKYSISNYQERISELSRENNNLEINSAQAGSLSSIAESIKELNFEKTEKIEYIKIMDTQVVIK